VWPKLIKYDRFPRYKVTKGLLDRFGDRRVIDSPITESGFCGLTVGAALAGLHPVVSCPYSPGIVGYVG
jgi:pyruvate/2-oxoglutarate/acetoin dehydrogenase E1 component